MKEYYFERLNVWEKCKNYALEIYKITAEFPASEKGLARYLRKLATSLSSRIAEGTAHISKDEQQRFYKSAYIVTYKMHNLLIISNDLELLSDEEYESLRNELDILSAMLYGLYKSIK